MRQILRMSDFLGEKIVYYAEEKANTNFVKNFAKTDNTVMSNIQFGLSEPSVGLFHPVA